MKAKFTVAVPVAAYLLWFCVSCGSEQPPRSSRPISKERNELPALFLTGETHQEVLRPGNVVCPFVDEKTGELCWPAYICTNPSCPGKGKTSGGRPLTFIHRDPLAKVGPDGNAVYVEVPPGKDSSEYILELGGTMYPTCPECLKIRNPQTETHEEKMQYAHWVEPYVLPESAKRLEELNQEEQRRREDLQRRKQQKR